MKHLLIWCLLAVAALSAAQGKQTFTGTITDDECGRADHTRMKMGPTDAACVQACISAHSGSYVLYDGKDVYTLSDQRAPEKFAVNRVGDQAACAGSGRRRQSEGRVVEPTDYRGGDDAISSSRSRTDREYQSHVAAAGSRRPGRGSRKFRSSASNCGAGVGRP